MWNHFFIGWLAGTGISRESAITHADDPRSRILIVEDQLWK